MASITQDVLDNAVSILNAYNLSEFKECVIRSFCSIFECGKFFTSYSDGHGLAAAACSFSASKCRIICTKEADATVWLAVTVKRVVAVVVMRDCWEGFRSFVIKPLYHPIASRIFSEFYGSFGAVNAIETVHRFRMRRHCGIMRMCSIGCLYDPRIEWHSLMECVFECSLEVVYTDVWQRCVSIEPACMFSSGHFYVFVVFQSTASTIIVFSIDSPIRHAVVEWANRNRLSLVGSSGSEYLFIHYVVESLCACEHRFLCGSLLIGQPCKAMEDLASAVAGVACTYFDSVPLSCGGMMVVASDGVGDILAVVSCSKTLRGYTLRTKHMNDASRRLFLACCRHGVPDPLEVLDCFGVFEIRYSLSYVRTSCLTVLLSETAWHEIFEIILGCEVFRAETVLDNFSPMDISPILIWLQSWTLKYVFVSQTLDEFVGRVAQKHVYIFEMTNNQVAVAASCVMGRVFLGV